ncbi:N-acetyltransferase family protein [Agrobacterium sp. ES01]|uniref:GNAT family N-acetyltransferase n=1 Tax=Agrobacterium sp. ES01 TaxID=3420714 RepID=UPI003D105856
MADEVTIRVAGPGDAELIHKALVSLARSRGTEEKMVASVPDVLSHGFGKDPAFETLIAEVDRVFAGLCLSFASFSTWRGERGVYVQDLFVEEAFRGRRVGERLLCEAARRGRRKGARYLRLSVDVENTKAQSFYERLGISHSRDEQIHMIKGEEFEAFAEAEQN